MPFDLFCWYSVVFGRFWFVQSQLRKIGVSLLTWEGSSIIIFFFFSYEYNLMSSFCHSSCWLIRSILLFIWLVSNVICLWSLLLEVGEITYINYANLLLSLFFFSTIGVILEHTLRPLTKKILINGLTIVYKMQFDSVISCAFLHFFPLAVTFVIWQEYHVWSTKRGKEKGFTVGHTKEWAWVQYLTVYGYMHIISDHWLCLRYASFCWVISPHWTNGE